MTFILLSYITFKILRLVAYRRLKAGQAASLHSAEPAGAEFYDLPDIPDIIELIDKKCAQCFNAPSAVCTHGT